MLSKKDDDVEDETNNKYSTEYYVRNNKNNSVLQPQSLPTKLGKILKVIKYLYTIKISHSVSSSKK